MKSSLEKLVQESKKVEVETERGHVQEVYLCPVDFQTIVIQKYIWVIHDIHKNTTGNWIELNLPDSSRHIVSLRTEGSTVSISGSRQYSKNEIRYTWICSKIQVVGNGWMKTSAWQEIEESYKKYNYDFEPPRLDSILCPTMLIPSFKAQNTVLECVIVLAIEFAYKYDIDKDDPVIVPKEHALLSVRKLHNEKTFADVIIDVKPENDEETQGEEIMAHKLILAARSKVFEAMFTLEMKEKKFCRIEIVDFKPKVVHDFLKYLYIGEANLEENAVELLKLANKYDIPELFELCQKYVGKNIVKIGWEAIFQLMDTYEGRLPIMKKMVQEYYKRNEMVLRNSKDFQSSIALFPELFMKLYISKN